MSEPKQCKVPMMITVSSSELDKLHHRIEGLRKAIKETTLLKHHIVCDCFLCKAIDADDELAK